jgi:hypothetical protein
MEYDLENTSGIAILVLWFRGCSTNTPKPQLAKVTIPAVVGDLNHKTNRNQYKRQYITRRQNYTPRIQSKLIAENAKS